MTHSLPQVRRLLSEAGLAPRRSLGQNFVVDPNTVRRIARLAGVGPGDQVLEIGAGLGSLTLALAETGANVTAIETDHSLLSILLDVLRTSGSAATVVHADARTFCWDADLGPGEWVAVANLPYNIGTTLILDLLDDAPRVSRMLVMVQREAGERLVASVGDPGYGAVSVRVALRGRAAIVGSVPPSVFHPRPEVESSLVAIERVDRGVPPAVVEVLVDLLRRGFGQRRKMLRRSLGATASSAAFAAASIDPSARPENLTLQDWLALAEEVRQQGSP